VPLPARGTAPTAALTICQICQCLSQAAGSPERLGAPPPPPAVEIPTARSGASWLAGCVARDAAARACRASQCHHAAKAMSLGLGGLKSRPTQGPRGPASRDRAVRRAQGPPPRNASPCACGSRKVASQRHSACAQRPQPTAFTRAAGGGRGGIRQGSGRQAAALAEHRAKKGRGRCRSCVGLRENGCRGRVSLLVAPARHRMPLLARAHCVCPCPCHLKGAGPKLSMARGRAARAGRRPSPAIGGLTQAPPGSGRKQGAREAQAT
jgi:hypothetical protein